MTLPPGLQAVRERASEMNAKSFRGEPWLMVTVDEANALLDLIETLAGALERYTERLPCEYNDRGYCQTHGCERPCKVEVKLAALDNYREFK